MRNYDYRVTSIRAKPWAHASEGLPAGRLRASEAAAPPVHPSKKHGGGRPRRSATRLGGRSGRAFAPSEGAHGLQLEGLQALRILSEGDST